MAVSLRSTWLLGVFLCCVVNCLTNGEVSDMDTTALVTAVQGVGTDITTVGAAIVLVAAAVMAFRWIKASFF